MITMINVSICNVDIAIIKYFAFWMFPFIFSLTSLIFLIGLFILLSSEKYGAS